MNKNIFNYRYWVLFALVTVAVIGFMAVPDEELEPLAYVGILILTKVIAFGAAYLTSLLTYKWGGEGKIDKLVEVAEVLEDKE